MRPAHIFITVLVLGAYACGGDDDAETGARTAGTDRGVATAFASGRAELSPEELESGRLDDSWRRHADEQARQRRASRGGQPARGDSDQPARNAGEAGADTAAWEDISPRTVNEEPTTLPLSGDIEGPAVARLQILLDAARFSPGVIDGRWGKNTEKAVYWFQEANGIEPTGEADRRTLDRLGRVAGLQQPVRSHTLTGQDVEGPFVPVPEDIYEQAELDCLCYRSLREKLGEVFHSTPELLEQLNPDVDLNAVTAGRTLQVPAVEPFRTADLPDGRHSGGGEVDRIVISDGGSYLHALDAAGDILYHFPSTLGADYSPSPTGEFTVVSVTFDPTWHYQPELLTGVDPDRPDVVVPAGPNNAVGVVWMQLSRDHYGIHGTSAPETIGYATSNGCVRLTNWDAAFLARRVADGTPVEFRDIGRKTSP